jgi:hypothetical protein
VTANMWAERACMRNGGDARPARLFILLSSADSHSTTKEQKHIYLSEIASVRGVAWDLHPLCEEKEDFLVRKASEFKTERLL